MAKNAVGRPSHVPDAKSRKYVEEMSAVGITQENIAKVIGISVDTLATHYRDELDNAAARANAAVGRSLWLQAVGGPKQDWKKAVPAAGIWWTKSRMRWREPPQEHQIGGNPDGSPIEVADHGDAREYVLGEIARLAARHRTINGANMDSPGAGEIENGRQLKQAI